MGSKADRRAARERVAAYHEASLTELVDHIAGAIDSYRAGELDAYELDETIHHYHRAARELWKFCWGTGAGSGAELVAHIIDDHAANDQRIDWWQRGKPYRR